MMKNWMVRNKRLLAGIILGAITGYGYYYFAGCKTGTCMISSNPLNSTLYFGFIGGLVSGTFKKNQEEKDKS